MGVQSNLHPLRPRATTQAGEPTKPSRRVLGLTLALGFVLAACVGNNPAPNPPNSPPLPPLPGTQPGLTPPPATTLTPPSTSPLTPSVTPTITASSDGRWDNAATWGGKLPAANDVVFIPRGRTVELVGQTANLEGLWVDGTLTFGDADIKLSSRYVVISGRFQAGTPTQPYTRRAEITLFGMDESQTIAGMGTKFIGVVNGGVLKLHGEQRLSWTQLSSSAPVGATSITLKDDAGTWRAGDKLVLAASGFDPRESEVVTVSAVNGSSVSFTPALKYARVAHLETIEGKTVDERPSVGLLSRNIVVRGAADSEANAFGGHIMVMAGGNAQISGVELTKMGQRGRFGRYPMHWHVAGDRSGNYLVSSAIHASFQRAAVVHSTNNVSLDGNVAFDIANHAFVWAEDGDEFGTQMTRNLAVLIRSPEERHFAFPINNAFFANSSQGEQRSAAFWGRSYDRHLIRGNISAGVLDGFGFFFDLFTPAPHGDDEGAGLVFDGNVAHSTYNAFPRGNQINYPEATTGHGLMITNGSSGKTEHVFRSFFGYHNVGGAWLEERSTRLKDSVLADNGIGVIVHRGVIDGVTVVGKSSNPIDVPDISASVSFGIRAGINVGGSNHGGKRAPIIENATIVNQEGVGVLWDLDHISPASLVKNVRFVNTADRLMIHDPVRFEFPDGPSFGLNDPNGQILGDGAPVRWTMYDSSTIGSKCKEVTDVRAFACARDSSFLLKSDTVMSLVDSAGRVIGLRRFDYNDSTMPDDGAVSLVTNAERYEVIIDDPASRIKLTLEDAANQSIELSFTASSAASKVTQAGQSLSSVASLAALRSASGSAHFHDGAAGRVYVRLVSSSATPQAVIIEGNFTENPTAKTGLAAVNLPSGAVSGFSSAVHSGLARYKMRQIVPASSPSRTATYNDDLINGASSGAALMGSASGDVTVLRAYVNAPVDGLYRLGLWGGGGGTAVFVGDTWVMGQPWAFINSNFVKNGQFESEVYPYLHPNGRVALKAGWHSITMVHAKMPENREGNTLTLRWATPQNPDLWVYPSVKRAP
jgi:G8 domain